jgi:hypothetical protein
MGKWQISMEEVLAYFKVLLLHLPGEADKRCE